MADRVYTYVDGESHFIRLEKAWQKLHGENATLGQLRYADQPDVGLILYLAHAKVFWTRRWSPGQRVTYFTAASGDEAAIHEIRKGIREFGLDHHVVLEKKMLADRRRALLDQGGVIEKAKAVDAAIFVRMLEDAQSDLYDLCNLYTSDVDYLPVIQAVMNRGKRVFVHGFRSGLGDYSPLEHVPNQFVDLNEMLKDECQLLRAP
jgi:uncharacterized LabA/DUF88 family protein